MRGAHGLVVALALMAAVSACGKSYGEEPSDGGGVIGDGALVVTPTNLDFGALPCGADGPPKLLLVQNKGAVEAPFKLEVPAGTTFAIVGPLEGVISAGASVTLQVKATTTSPSDTKVDILFTSGNEALVIHAAVRGAGALLQAFPSVVDFGDVRKENGGGPTAIEISNTGSKAATITPRLSLGSPDFVVPASEVKIDPGAKASVKVSLIAGAAGSIAGTLDIQAKDALCGKPLKIQIKAKRVTSDVTLSAADYGQVSCLETAKRDILISNYSTTALNVAASLMASSAFTIVSEASQTIAAGTPTAPTVGRVTIQPKPFGTNLKIIQEDLSVDIMNLPVASGGGLRKAPIRADVRGAVLSVIPRSLFFSSSGAKGVAVTNTGNEAINLDWSVQASNGAATAWGVGLPSSFAAGATANGNIGFAPPQKGAYSAQVVSARSIFATTDACSSFPMIDLAGAGPGG